MFSLLLLHVGLGYLFWSDDSDEIPEFNPVILVKIYLYFAVNSFWKKHEYLLALQRPKVMKEKSSSICRLTNYYILLQKPQAHTPIFVF